MPHPHINSPAYAPPVLRPPSPASSLGTSYAPAGDTLHELDLSDGEFGREIHNRLRLGREFVREWRGDISRKRSEEDLEADENFRIEDEVTEGWGQDPLIAFGLGPRTEAENKSTYRPPISQHYRISYLITVIHEQILRSLRYRIHLIQEDALFEQTLLRSSQAASTALEHNSVPTTGDIDTLLKSMMVSPPTNANADVGSTTANTTGTTTVGPWSRKAVVGMDTPGSRKGAPKGKARSKR